MKTYTLNHLEKHLLERHKIFCHEYVQDWNATRAYKKTYPNSNKNTAVGSAIKLLKQPKISQYIQLIKEQYEQICQVSKAKQINEYKAIAFSNMAEIYEDWGKVKDFDLLSAEHKAAIQSIEVKTSTKLVDGYNCEILSLKITLHDKIQALSNIDKLMGYNPPTIKRIVSPNSDKSSNLVVTDEEQQIINQILSKYAR